MSTRTNLVICVCPTVTAWFCSSGKEGRRGREFKPELKAS